MRGRLLITLLLLVPACAAAQHLRLCGDTSRTALYLDINRLWSYNLYEHSRWGAGLRLGWHGDDGRAAWADIYGGYGVEDLQAKGGMALTLPLPRGAALWMGVRRDYEGAGVRRLSGGSITEPASLASVMTRRMTDRVELAAGVEGWRLPRGPVVGVDGRLWAGWRLFDGTGMLHRAAADSLPREDGFTVSLTARSRGGLRGELRLGHVWPAQKTVARLLAEYGRSLTLGPSKVGLYAQGGVAAPGTPYTHLFDLGGTAGAPLFFDRTLLTAAPVEFTASLFALASVRVATAGPLWHFYSHDFALGSHTVPFLQLTGAWGALWGQDATGALYHEGLALQAPMHGIAEAAAGVEGLVRWGVADWGVAVAYRLTHPKAPYHRARSADNLALMLTAKLVF